ncbi:hypothetical protein C0Q70_00991 [Pomacea canaliculata]|uniref:Cytochrome P450 n=1 Tax=Pomacea canaliculata TaxID=400727 RepID=A0A2T7PYA6_POMCA|nr:hypothetical protein C0Q70_00991 [Pomacea canaliculata]
MEIVFGVDIPLLLLLLPLAILLLYWQGMRSYNFWSSRGIPGPKPQPFFGHEWQVQKKMESYINSCSEVFSKNIQEIARHGGKIIVKEYCGAFTMDVITGTVFGIVVNSQKDFQNEFVTNAKLLLQHGGAPRTLTPFLNRLNQYLQNPFVKKEDPHGFLYKAIRRIVADRKEETVPRKKTDFVQLLINAETSEDFVGAVSENAKRLTPDEIVAQMVIFFIAGYETTATTLHFMIYNLAMYPDIQQKIVDEIQQQIGDEVPTNDNVSKLKYMEQTIKETLRLFPPVPAINRVASETVTIKGVTIPKGVGVLIPIYDVMRDPEYFPDPEVFRPERFSEEAKDEMNPALSWHSASDPACASASIFSHSGRSVVIQSILMTNVR